MTLPKLNMRPDQDAYGFDMTSGLISTGLDGGPPRTRLDVANGWMRMSVQWTTNLRGYEYLQQCYRYAETNGGAHFTIDLILNHGAVTNDCEAMFVPGTFGLKSTRGLMCIVKAEILVAPQLGDDATWPADSDFQDALLTEGGTPIVI